MRHYPVLSEIILDPIKPVSHANRGKETHYVQSKALKLLKCYYKLGFISGFPEIMEVVVKIFITPRIRTSGFRYGFIWCWRRPEEATPRREKSAAIFLGGSTRFLQPTAFLRCCMLQVTLCSPNISHASSCRCRAAGDMLLQDIGVPSELATAKLIPSNYVHRVCITERFS